MQGQYLWRMAKALQQQLQQSQQPSINNEVAQQRQSLEGQPAESTSAMQHVADELAAEDSAEGFTRSISLYWNWMKVAKAASRLGKVGCLQQHFVLKSMHAA